MEKNKKRNELSIFEELRLKPEGVAPKIPNKEDLEPIEDLYFYYDKLLKKKYILDGCGLRTNSS